MKVESIDIVKMHNDSWALEYKVTSGVVKVSGTMPVPDSIREALEDHIIMTVKEVVGDEEV